MSKEEGKYPSENDTVDILVAGDTGSKRMKSTGLTENF